MGISKHIKRDLILKMYKFLNYCKSFYLKNLLNSMITLLKFYTTSEIIPNHKVKL